MLVLVSLMLILFGFIVVLLGVIIWKKKKMAWVSSHSNVKQNNVKLFTRIVGQSTIGFGVSICCMGVLWAINWLTVEFIALPYALNYHLRYIE
jgi:amino acid transporter